MDISPLIVLVRKLNEDDLYDLNNDELPTSQINDPGYLKSIDKISSLSYE